MKQDISTTEDVKLLVDRFYDKIKSDKLVGFIFTEALKVNWEKHLPVMYAFWENALFFTGGYSGNTLKKHLNIHKAIPLQKKYFVRWLQLFNETVDEHFEGKTALLAKQKANNIAAIIQVKIKQAGAIPRH